jgi:hypothetical protein
MPTGGRLISGDADTPRCAASRGDRAQIRLDDLTLRHHGLEKHGVFRHLATYPIGDTAPWHGPG